MTNSTKLEIGDIVKHKSHTDSCMRMVVTNINKDTNQITCEFQHPNGYEFVSVVSLPTSLTKVKKNA